VLQLSAVARDSGEPRIASRLEAIKELAADVLEEVRLLAHTVYPRVLDNLGLQAALEKLAREASQSDPILEVTVDANEGARGISQTCAAVFYQVAQEGVSNALKHGAPRAIRIMLESSERVVQLEIADDGNGFDPAETAQHPGMGLFALRERLSLVDGELDVVSQPGGGTRIVASVPLNDRNICHNST
jgi:signal transduction histidine kinase